MSSIHLSVSTFEFLQNQRKYPSSSLGMGQQYGDEHFEPTISVIDPETDRILAIIEMREDSSETTLKDSAKACADYLRRSLLTVPIYLITPSKKNDYDVCVFILTGKSKWQSINKDYFPTYEELLANRTTHDRAVHKTDTSLSEFANIANLLCVFMLLLFVCSLAGAFSLTREQLVILGGIVVCATLPYYTRVKAFGFEAERQADIESSVQEPQKKIKVA